MTAEPSSLARVRGRLGRRRLRTPLRAAARLAALCCAAAPALALEPDLGHVVSRLPERVQFVAAMDDGARLRRSLGDSPLMLALASVPRPAKVFDAWSQLSTDLGMTDAEAFDLLLGRRVVFAATGLQAGDSESQWALLSELDPATDRRLRADLGAVPRRLVDGQPVLELEHGSFLLATSNGRLRCTADGSFEASPASTIMLLAPAEDRELFDEMLPLLHCQNPATTISRTPGGAAAARLGAKDAVFLWRLPDAETAPDRFLAGTIGLDGSRWDIRAIAGPTAGWVPETDLARLEPWAPTMLDTLPGEPALAVIGLRAMVEAQMWLVPLLSPGVPEADLDALDTLLGDRSMLALWLSPEGQPSGDPRAEVLVAHEASDIRALSARSDAMLGAPQGAPASPHGESPALLQPHDPFQVRTMRLPSLADLAAPAERPSIERPRAEREPGPTLHWTCVAEEGAVGRAGWLVVHFDPTGAAGVEEPRPPGSTSDAGGLPARRYLHVGRAAPDRLTDRAALAAALTLASPGSVTSKLLSRVRSLEWAVWLDGQRDALDVELSLRAAEPPRPAQ
ncbi:MAG TPA: hypothetical protein VFF69_02030 [Phycisphaerales bacterium]|nr:hypothetical protein [Phycisphaerales bacterium]